MAIIIQLVFFGGMLRTDPQKEGYNRWFHSAYKLNSTAVKQRWSHDETIDTAGG